MRIYITHNNFTFVIPVPTRLFLNKPVVKLANCACKGYCPEMVPDIDPEDVEKLYQEIKKCKKRYGKKWDLVDVQSASGEEVRIRL